MKSAERVYAESFAEGIRPEPLLMVSEWSDEYRRLSAKAASEPGPWRTSRTPYLKEIMDCLSSSSPVERVVFMAGTQLGKTETGNNWIGYVIHHAPGPMMAVQTTVEMANRLSKQRNDGLKEERPVLRERIKPARSRDSGNTVQSKEFPGGVLVLTGANSAVGLRSMPARYLFLDEVDAYPGDVDGEGDPVMLAEARTRTFSRRKIYIVSTTTIKGTSRIEREYLESDQRRYMIPCPSCGSHQWLKFEQLKWPKDKPEEAKYECEHCQYEIEEHHKTWMLENGFWEAQEEGDGRTAGFHLSSLYSPLGWRSWTDIAKAWVRALGNDAAVKAFKNTELAETWEEHGDAPEWERLYERREDYFASTVPMGVRFLTAGIDIQQDRIEMSVWGWGRDLERWLVEHRVLEGDTARKDVWDRLTEAIYDSWRHECGVDMNLRRLCVDSGYATQEVYAWARKQSSALVTVIKGVERGSALVGMPTSIDVTDKGKRIKNGIRIRTVVGGIGKLEIYNKLRLSKPVLEDGDCLLYTSPSPRDRTRSRMQSSA